VKRCTRCEAEKPLAAFSKASRSKDGLHWWCKECFASYYRATRERILERNREWREANPDYFHKNYVGARAIRLVNNKAYYEKHRTRLLMQMREYRRSNLPKFRIYGRAAYARKVGAPVVEHVSRLKVLEIVDGLCGICLTLVDPSNFHVDHIVPLSGGGDHTYANTQPAHPVCNLRKGARQAAA